MINGIGPKWLLDIESLTQSMNYVPVVAGNNGTSQEGIVMPIWKDASYFETTSINKKDDSPESSNAADQRNDEKSNDDKKDDENDELYHCRDTGKRIANDVLNDYEVENE
ncbi:hypothetical protein Tco_0325381, partial [Tanacetum coccineum]